MSQLEKQPEVGDVLLLEYEGGRKTMLVRVVKTKGCQPRSALWEAEHICHLLTSEKWGKGTLWYGPDPQSWTNVTNLGKLNLEGEVVHVAT